MHTQKRKNLFFQGGVIGLIIIVLLVKFLLDLPFRRQIPAIPDLQSVSQPLRDQITHMNGKAKRRPGADNLGQLGMVYHSSAYYDEAVQCYRLAAKKSKSKWLWDYYLGYIHKEMGESDASIESFRSVIRKNPKVYHARYYLGEGYQNRNMNDKAEVSFKSIAGLKLKAASSNKAVRNDYYPISTYGKYQLAQAYINSGKTDQAEKILLEIIRDHGSFGPAYRLLGNVYSLKGDTASSRDYVLRAGDLLDYKAPVDTLIDRLSLISRSDLYILKQIDEAERSVYPEWALILTSNAMRFMPENRYLVSKFVRLSLTMGNGKQALNYLDRHLSSFGDDFNEIKLVGDMLYDKGYYAQSVNYFRKASEIKQDNADVKASLVLACLNAGNKDQAMDLLNTQLEKEKKDSRLLANAVYIMLTMHDRDKARLYLRQLMQSSPASPKTYQLRALMAEQDGKPGEAIALYESALKGNPGDLVSIQSLNEIYVRQKMWGRSASLLKSALVSYPNEPYLLEKLGTLLVTCPDKGQRNYREGLAYSQRAFINKASTPEITFMAGRSIAEAYAALGDKNNALIYLNHVLTMAESQHVPGEIREELRSRINQLRE